MPGIMGSSFRHRHLFYFHKVWDIDADGVITWEDFDLTALKYAVLQRHGKYEKDVVERWEKILKLWWDTLSQAADDNKDTKITFEEWLKFFYSLGQTTKCFKELPDFLKAYSNLGFVHMDFNKDGLIDVKDYRMFLAASNMNVAKAEECFNFMLNEDDKKNGNTINRDRFNQLIWEFWACSDLNAQGQYLSGPYESCKVEELERLNVN